MPLMFPQTLWDLNLWDEGENKVIGFTIDDTKMNEYLQTVLSS